MKTRTMMVLTGAGLALGALAPAQRAEATVFQWNFAAGQPGVNYVLGNNAGGQISTISSTFDNVTKQLDFSVTFSDQVAQGFWLAINDGPNPKGHAGEMAVLYFDGSSYFDANPLNNAVVLTAYTYNGSSGPDSWTDGSSAPGVQAPDLIHGANEGGSWINSVQLVDAAGERTLSFSVDASAIIAHTPLYPDAIDPWHGTGYGNRIGVWMHTAASISTTYGAGRGALTSATFTGESFMDGNQFMTSIIPGPGTGVVVGVLGVVGMRRRRKA